MTATTCRDCHRPLRDAVSKTRGYGPDCWRKHLEVQAILATARHRVAAFNRSQWDEIPGQEQLEIEAA